MKALVVEGGALRTVFSSGVLDAFTTYGYDPFDIYIGVSGGSMAMSYFLSKQYRDIFEIILKVSRDERFMGLKNLIYQDGYINLSYLLSFSESNYRFKREIAAQNLAGKKIEIVVTRVDNGKTVYLRPNKNNWLTCMKASATLPFLTKGYCWVDGVKYMDGGWSAPIPAKRALDLGAHKILVIRSQPLKYKSQFGYVHRIGKLFNQRNPKLAKQLEIEHKIYNKSLYFLEGKHKSKILQIAPPDFLKTTAFSANHDTLYYDYRTGLDMAIQFLYEHAENF